MKNFLKGLVLWLGAAIAFGVMATLSMAASYAIWNVASKLGNGSILPYPGSLMPAIAVVMLCIVPITSFLFYRNDHWRFEGYIALILFPRWPTPKRAWGWVSKLPDILQPGLLTVVAILLMALPYLAVGAMVLNIFNGAIAIFVAGWYFCWLTIGVKSGQIKFWPWLVQNLHRATAGSNNGNNVATHPTA